VETTCPKGFTKLKSGKCQRIVQEPDEEQEIQLPNLNLKGTVRPRKKCNEGFTPDKNGRCVPIQ
jgi:hypothetical protein